MDINIGVLVGIYSDTVGYVMNVHNNKLYRVVKGSVNYVNIDFGSKNLNTKATVNLSGGAGIVLLSNFGNKNRGLLVEKALTGGAVELEGSYSFFEGGVSYTKSDDGWAVLTDAGVGLKGGAPISVGFSHGKVLSTGDLSKIGLKYENGILKGK